MNIELISGGPEETQRIGKVLGQVACPGQVFLLTGPLGAGKTCFTQGILWGLGSDEIARSPTFVIVSQYDARLTLYHVDLYRLGSALDVFDLGLDECLNGDGITVVEWADKAPGLLGDEYMSIAIEPIDDEIRRIALSATGSAYTSAIDAMKHPRGIL